MDELMSLRSCARELQITPMSLTRYVRRYAIPTLAIGKSKAVRPSEVREILTGAGVYPKPRRETSHVA